jgi:adenylylsulfate kinase
MKQKICGLKRLGGSMVILITGKPGSGKSHYAFQLAQELREEGKLVRVLDGDSVRQANNDNDYSDNGRRNHLMRMATLAAKTEDADVIVIIAAVSPKREWRDDMRAMWVSSRLVYLPGGSLWKGTEYMRPQDDEF